MSQISIGQQKSFLSPVIDIFNGEILNYNIADRADLEQINKMLNDLFAITDKLAKENQIILHSGLMKSELLYNKEFKSMKEFKKELEAYIDWYNNDRIRGLRE